ncbi:MAG: sulfite exporter TauE/SafE family protein [Bryobacteraceae bacterium]
MTFLDLGIPLGLGLVSSLHCAQMCGPVVLSYGLPLRQSRREAITGHLLYNAGRLVTYGMLGAVAGAAGTLITNLAGAERAATVAAGALMILAALLMSGWLPSSSLVTISKLPASKHISGLMFSPNGRSKFWLGLGFGFLPCGLIYAALLKAAETSSAVDGFATMVAFGAGTASALLGIGLFSFALPLRSARLAPVTVALLGAFLIYRGLTAIPNAAGCHHG